MSEETDELIDSILSGDIGDDEETPCPKREDEIHCVHWWEGEPCCDCGDNGELGRKEKTNDP